VLNVAPRDNTLRIRREVTLSVTKAASDAGRSRVLSFASLPGVSDMTSLFQEYRILKVHAQWILVNGLNANNEFPTLVIAPQHYSQVAVPVRDEVAQYNGVQTFQFAPSKNVYKRSFDVYAPVLGVSSSQNYLKSPWWRVDDSPIHVWGIEFIARYNTVSTPNHTLELILDVDVELRATR